MVEEAANQLADDGVSAHVVDLRTLVPLDEEGLVEAVEKTGRCVVVHEAPAIAGLGAEVIALLQEQAFYSLEAPVRRVTAPDGPLPHASHRTTLRAVRRVDPKGGARSAERIVSTIEFTFPDVGEGLTQGEIIKWHVAVGDQVKADQIIVDVQTDKAIVEIPAPVSGRVSELGGNIGDTLAVGGILATFEVDGSQPSVPTSAPPKKAPARGKILASPAVRKRARELGIDLSAVAGSGDRGQVSQADLEAITKADPQTKSMASVKAVSTPAPSGEDRVEPLRGLRRQIASTMQAAWQEIPHIFNIEEIDATDLVRAREGLNAELEPQGVKLSFMPFFVKACGLALKAHPSFNASIDMQREEIIYRHRYNIGIATAAPDGLMVPVLHDADRLTLAELSHAITEIAQLARTRKVSVAQISNGTFTISNFGSYGTGVGMPVIRPPEVAIAGFGRVQDGVIPIAGKPEVRPVLPVVVATDHRLNDGIDLGAFMATLITYLREPVRLVAQL